MNITVHIAGSQFSWIRATDSCKAAGIGEDWTPRELRHTFVSLMSESGVTLEEIARLVGHSSTATTEQVYRHELRPVLQRGAEVMDQIFKPKTF